MWIILQLTKNTPTQETWVIDPPAALVSTPFSWAGRFLANAVAETLQGRGEVWRGHDHAGDSRQQVKHHRAELGATARRCVGEGAVWVLACPALPRAHSCYVVPVGVLLRGARRCSVVKLVERRRSTRVRGFPACSISWKLSDTAFLFLGFSSGRVCCKNTLAGCSEAIGSIFF